MQEPTDDSGAQPQPPNKEELVENQPPKTLHQANVGENVPVGGNQAPPAPMSSKPSPDGGSSVPESGALIDSAVPITPILDVIRSSKEPWRIFFTRLRPINDSIDPRTITPASVSFEKAIETEQDELWSEMEKMPRRLAKSLILPQAIQRYESTEKLIESIVTLLRSHTSLPERDCSLVAYWSIATWFLDFLPFLPSLVVTGPPLAADRLLRTLVAICRRPLAMADVSAAVLLSLPLNGLRPTLLIRKPQLNRRLAALLDPSNQPGYWACAGGDFNDLYFAKCIYVGEQPSHPLITPNSIHVHVGGRSRRVLLPMPTDSDIQVFQNKLLLFRFAWHDRVAASKLQVPETQFSPEVAAIAQVLGMALVSEPHLQRDIKELLQGRDQQSRVDSLISLDGVVLRGVLFHCHQTNQEKVFVHEIAEAANEINRQEGESLRISNETTGHVLRNLGLYTRRLGNKGRGFVLDKSTQSQVHRLAHSYDVLPVEPSCGYCHHLQVQEPEGVVQEV